MKHKAIIFDFFGVLCSEVSPFWFKENFKKNSNELKDHFIQPADRGEISQEQLFAELSKVSGTIAEVIESDWIERAHIDFELLDFIKSLKNEYKLGLLSNAVSSYFYKTIEGTDVEQIFDSIVISSEINYIKPEPEAFWEILNRLNVKPEECIFIDDNPINVEAANKLGMTGHLFTSTQEVEKFIKNTN